MGREAMCRCTWGAAASEPAEVKALLEGDTLILRGAMRMRIAIAEMKEVKAEGDLLRFSVGGEPVALALGSATALRWATVLATPPPTLAKKLGISSQVSVQLLGELDAGEDEALLAALAEASQVSKGEGDLVIARADTAEALSALVRQVTAKGGRRSPVWIVYPKGKGNTLSEDLVRSTMRDRGWMDTKVAAVSPRLTALRFIARHEGAAAL